MFVITLLYSYIAKLIIFLIRVTGRGSATTAAGLLIEKFIPSSISILGKGFDKIILVSGTNGKTTTRYILSEIYKANRIQVCTNRGGANIMRGIANTLLENWNLFGKPQRKTAILEVEEATLPKLTKYIQPDEIILTNIFRDQLDMYGEIDTTLDYFKTTLRQCPNAKLYINMNDYKLLSILKDLEVAEVHGFGVQDSNVKMLDYESESIKHRVNYKTEIVASSIQPKNMQSKIYTTWLNGGSTHILVKSDLLGNYNAYNILAAMSATLGIFGKEIVKTIEQIQPVFGRGEKIEYLNKEIFLFLVKNPAGMNQTLKLIKDHFTKEDDSIVSFLVNDNIADGRDVSWLWDCTMLENICQRRPNLEFLTSGKRGMDMLLRLETAGAKVKQEDNYSTIQKFTEKVIFHLTPNQSKKYIILATYTSMMQFRKTLSQKMELPKINKY